MLAQIRQCFDTHSYATGAFATLPSKVNYQYECQITQVPLSFELTDFITFDRIKVPVYCVLYRSEISKALSGF